MSVDENEKFVLKNVFTGVLNMENGDKYEGPIEYHLRIPWRLSVCRNEDNFVVQVHCWAPSLVDYHLILIDYKAKLKSKNGLVESDTQEHYFTLFTHSTSVFASETVENYLTDGSFNIEVHVEIKFTSGIKTEDLRKFDESMKKFSDVVLVVKNEKFYVLKKYLAAHSSYFKSLFSENIDEPDHGEIELEDVEPYDFQNFLEVLHGEPSVQENTIWGIIHLAEMFDSMTVFRKCRACDNVEFHRKIREKMKKLEEKFQNQLGFDFEGNKQIHFDETMKEYSDVVLKVDGEKFYVLKKHLASHSSYFESLFFGDFDELGQSEITLKNIDPFDIRNFLEVIYGEPVINDRNVKGILKLADMYDSKTALSRCDEFLTDMSKLSVDKKYKFAINYSLEKLKENLDSIDESRKKEKEDQKTEVPGSMLRLCFRRLKNALRK